MLMAKYEDQKQVQQAVTDTCNQEKGGAFQPQKDFTGFIEVAGNQDNRQNQPVIIKNAKQAEFLMVTRIRMAAVKNARFVHAEN
jgi:hypothetical protein